MTLDIQQLMVILQLCAILFDRDTKFIQWCVLDGLCASVLACEYVWVLLRIAYRTVEIFNTASGVGSMATKCQTVR
jgi:hypothetical protein